MAPSQVTLEWEQPSFWGGCCLSHYEIEYREHRRRDALDRGRHQRTGEWQAVQTKGAQPRVSVFGNFFAIDARCRAYNVGTATPSAWSDEIHISEEREQAAKRAAAPPTAAAGSAAAAAASLAEGGVAVVSQIPLEASVGKRHVLTRAMGGWSEFARAVGHIFVSLGVAGGVRGTLFDLSPQQVEELVCSSLTDSSSLSLERPLLSLARVGVWVMATLAHHAENSGEWIALMNEVEGLVTMSADVARELSPDDEQLAVHAREILLALLRIYETRTHAPPPHAALRAVRAADRDTARDARPLSTCPRPSPRPSSPLPPSPPFLPLPVRSPRVWLTGRSFARDRLGWGGAVRQSDADGFITKQLTHKYDKTLRRRLRAEWGEQLDMLKADVSTHALCLLIRARQATCARGAVHLTLARAMSTATMQMPPLARTASSRGYTNGGGSQEGVAGLASSTLPSNAASAAPPAGSGDFDPARFTLDQLYSSSRDLLTLIVRSDSLQSALDEAARTTPRPPGAAAAADDEPHEAPQVPKLTRASSSLRLEPAAASSARLLARASTSASTSGLLAAVAEAPYEPPPGDANAAAIHAHATSLGPAGIALPSEPHAPGSGAFAGSGGPPSALHITDVSARGVVYTRRRAGSMAGGGRYSGGATELFVAFERLPGAAKPLVCGSTLAIRASRSPDWEDQLVTIPIAPATAPMTAPTTAPTTAPATAPANQHGPLTLRAKLCEQWAGGRQRGVIGVTTISVDPTTSGVVGPIELTCPSGVRGVLLAFSIFAEADAI